MNSAWYAIGLAVMWLGMALLAYGTDVVMPCLVASNVWLAAWWLDRRRRDA